MYLFIYKHIIKYVKRYVIQGDQNVYVHLMIAVQKTLNHLPW
jgi:hypothetical protein